MKSKWFVVVTVIFAVIVLVEGYFIYDLSKQKKSEPHISYLQETGDTLMNNPFKKFDDWNSFEDIQKFQRNMDNLLRNFNSTFQADANFEKLFQDLTIPPAIDIINSKDKYIVKVNLPGVEDNKINVNVKDGVLTVETKVTNEKSDKDSKFIERERFMGNFKRSIVLPKDVIVSKMKTFYKNGVLTITFPKKNN